LWFLITGFPYQTLAVEEPNQTIRNVPEEEMTTILNLIASQVRNNYERINTWSGKIDKKITWVHTGSLAEDIFKNATDAKGEAPEAILQKVESKVVFAVDVKKNFVYVDTSQKKPRKYFNYKTGEDLGNSGSNPDWYSTIISTPDFSLKAEPFSFEKGTGRILRNKAVKKPSKREQQTGWYKLSDIWDPRRAFFPGASFTWQDLDWPIKRLNKFGKIEFDGYKFQMEEHMKCDNIEYKVISPSVVNLERSKPEHYAILTMIFSSQCGFNMIYWEAATGSGMVFQRYNWEYELIDGVYLPKRMIIKLYGPMGEMTTEKDLTYANNNVNQEIPADTFEYTNLKLKDGDIFIDEILNKEYRYKADTRTLQPVEK
jgi:hypothetical protein